jgi:hypothetical protein
MNDGDERRDAEETAGRERWLAVSEPLPVDDDPAWESALADAA